MPSPDDWALPSARTPELALPPAPKAEPSVDQWALPNAAAAIRNNLSASLGQNPEQEATLRRAALATGTPLPTARNMPDAVKAQAQLQAFDSAELVRKAPHLAEFLTDPDRTRLIHDDIPTTAHVEQQVASLGRSPGAFMDPATQPVSYRDRLTAWLRDVVGLPPAGRDEGAAARAFLDVEAKRQGVSRDDLRSALGGVSPVPQQFAANFISSFTAGIAPDTAGAPDTTAGGIAAGAGQLGGFLLGAPLKIAEAGLARVAPAAERTVGEAWVKGLAKDMTRQAATLGLASGVAATGKALDSGTAGAAAGEVGKAGLGGAATGTAFGAAGRLFPENTIAQGFARALATSATLDAISGQRPWDDRPLAQKVFDYGLNAFFSLNGAGRTAGGWLHDAARADAAVQDANVLGGVAQAAAASKLRERDPELFKAFIAKVSDGQPVPDVYVDGTALAEALHQSGIGTDELDAKLPALRPLLEEALSTGGQVRIPVEDFATHIAGGPLQDALLPHLRTDPEGMSQAEASAFHESHVDQMKAEAERITAEAASRQPLLDSQKQVHDAVLGQLEAAGRFRPEVNSAYAALTRDFYTTMAERTGQMPHELFAEHPLAVTAESLAGSLSQGERGAYSPDTHTISLLKGADLSTTLHELGHHFFETLGKLAARPDAPEPIKADMAQLLKVAGFEGGAADWLAQPLDARREGHETVARSFEGYLLEGKAPTAEQAGLFRRFRSWLLNVYKSLSALKVELSPEVRGVFDRMLASGGAVRQAEAARQMVPMFSKPPEGMPPEEWIAYQNLGAEATNAAIEGLSARTVKDMAWSDRVRSKALRDLAGDAAEKRKAVQSEVSREVDRQPVYGALRFLKRGEIVAPDGTVSPVEGPHKLDIKAMADRYGGEGDQYALLDWSRLGYGKYGMLGENGLHPDQAAEMHGFASGDELVRALLEAPKRGDVVRQMTEQRMLERHGDIANPVELAKAADEAVHNEVRTRFVATELKALDKSRGPARVLAAAAREVAETTIAGRQMRDISERPYLAAEAKAGELASKRLAAGDIEGAAVAKRDQLLNMELARAALNAQRAVDKGRAYLKRFDRESVRKNIDVDIRDQIDSLLERFDLRANPSDAPTRAQQNLADWVEAQQAAGYSPAIPPELLDPTVREHFKEMRVERFTGLVDSVKALEHIGKERRALTIEGKKVDLNEYVRTRLVPKLAEVGQRFTPDQLLETAENRHSNEVAVALDHFGSWLRGAAAQLKPQEFKRNQYDRHEILGPFGEAITDPVMNANYAKVRMLKGLSDDFQRAADELGRKWQDSMRESVDNQLLADPDQAGKMLRMTRGRMIGIAIHVGNESNFAKVAKGWGWEGADVWRFLDQHMSEKDWKAVQTVWDLYDKHWPDMEAMNRRLGNTMPDKIEPRPFETKFGQMRGGYAAIAYDALRSRRGEKEAQSMGMDASEGLFGREYFRADTTTNGSMNQRIEGYTDRVDLDFHTIPQRMQQTIHDLAYRETLVNANKVLEHPDFKKAFKAAYGLEAYRSLQDWIGRIANGGNTDRQVGALGKFLQYTRTGMVINAIAFRATTVLKHGGSAGIKSLGYFAGGGEKYFASRMASISTDLVGQVEGARAKFGEINNRLLQQDRDYRALSSTMFEPDSPMAKAHRFGHAAVAWSDMLTAVPTAWAAYDRAIIEGIPKSQGGTGEPMTEAQAVNYANKVVREAHGSTAEASRSMVLNTNSEAVKMFSTLYGFMNNSYGQQLDGFDKLRTSGISNGPVLARTFMAIIVPALWAGLLTHGAPNEDKGEGWGAWVGKAVASEVASSVPFVRDAVAFAEGYSHAGLVAAENWLATLLLAGKDAVHAVQGNESGKKVRDIANAIGIGLHIPGMGQLGQSVQYIQDVKAGKEVPQNAWEYAQGVVTGHGKRTH